MILSFKKGRPIAKIIDSNIKDLNNKLIRVSEESNDEKEIVYDDIYDILNENEISKILGKKRINNEEMKDLEDYIYGKKDITEKNYKNKNDLIKIKNRYEEMNQKEYILKGKGTIVPYPNPETRDVIYVAGPSGAGKSTFCESYMQMYKTQFPKNKIYIFSRLDKDPAFDNIKVIRIKLDEELINDPINPIELKNSLVLFDDIDTIPNDKIRESVSKLRDDLLETGRHQGIYLLITSHLLMDYKKTRTILNEAQMVILYPKSGSTYHMQRYMKVYAGLQKSDIDKILNLPSRWVGIHKSYPNYVIYSSGVYLLNK
jgi:hypothetical protein